MQHFYGTIYITLRAFYTERAIYTDASHPVCPYSIPWRKCEPRTSHSPRSSSFRNLSSNEVRYKFREREKVKITFPTKSDAKNHDPALSFMASGRRIISDEMSPASSKSAVSPMTPTSVLSPNYSISVPAKRKLCHLKSFGESRYRRRSFLPRKEHPRNSRKPPSLNKDGKSAPGVDLG
mgnify:CR=1 FL=1